MRWQRSGVFRGRLSGGELREGAEEGFRGSGAEKIGKRSPFRACIVI